MSRYIDTDMLDEVVLDLNTKHNRGITRADYKCIESVLFDFPTIDAVEVVRCKDCKWMDMVYLYCNWHDSVVEEDGYCCKGEREE